LTHYTETLQRFSVTAVGNTMKKRFINNV